MSIFPGLVQGLTRALVGYQGGRARGEQQRRQENLQQQEMQRQARQDMLAEQLMGARIADYQRQAQQPVNPVNIDPLSEAGVAAQLQIAQGRPQAPRNLDPNDPAVLQRRMDAEFRQAQRMNQAGLGQQRQAGVPEREKASAAAATIRANAIINRLEAADPTIGARVAQKAAARRSIIAALGRRLGGISDEQAQNLIESQIEQSMTPEELEYYVGTKEWLGGALPGLSGKAVTAREWVIQAPRFFSLGAANPATTKQRRGARATRSRGFALEAGPAMQEWLPGLQDLDLSEYGLGGAPATQPAEPTAPQQTVGGRRITRTVDPRRFFRP